MRDLLFSLYGSKFNINDLEKRFKDIVVKYRKLRPSELIKYEKKISPLWYKNEPNCGYILYLDLFSPEAKPGEKIKALKNKLPYFEELGINILHILPVLKSSGDAGYAVDDYREIDGKYGTGKDFTDLINAAHQKGIKIILDFVLNHTSDNHKWAKSVKKGDKKYRNFYIFDETGQSWPGVSDVFPDFAPGHWDYVPELKKWVWSTFYKRHPLGQPGDKYGFSQWDLNYKNPDVFFAMLENLLYLANMGVDVFRLDAVPFLWKEKGTKCESLPQTYEIVKLFRKGLNLLAPKSIFLAEAYQKPKEIVKYIGEYGDGVQTAYHFTLMSALWYLAAFGDKTKITSVINRMPKTPKTASWFVFTECHDQVSLEMLDVKTARKLYKYFIGFGNLAFHRDKNLDFAWGISGTSYSLLNKNLNLLKLLDSVKMTLGYNPLLYMGEELALENDLSFQNDTIKREDTRFIKRLPIPDTIKERRKIKGTKEYEMFTLYSYLTGLRKKYPLIAKEPTVFDTGVKSVFGYYKNDSKTKITFLANFSKDPQTVSNGFKTPVVLKSYEFKYFIG